MLCFWKVSLEILQKCIQNSIAPQPLHGLSAHGCWEDLREAQRQRALNGLCSVSGYMRLCL